MFFYLLTFEKTQLFVIYDFLLSFIHLNEKISPMNNLSKYYCPIGECQECWARQTFCTEVILWMFWDALFEGRQRAALTPQFYIFQ